MRAVSDPDFYNAMKRTLFSYLSRGRLGKTLVVSSLLLSLGIPFSAQSAIRILGPVEESPPSSATEPLTQQNQAPLSSVNRRQTVGPTRDSDTLWSIASRYQPNNSVTVYQTIGAIFRLNPGSFEDANIHGLIPGSTLLMPTLTEIRRESTGDVASRLQIDEARKDAKRVANQPLSQQVTTPAVTTPKTTPKPEPKPEPAMVEKTKPEMEAGEPEAMAENAPMKEKEVMEPKGDMSGAPTKPNMSAVQNQINESDLQMGKLVESNHILKIRLAEVQNELAAMKDQMSADEELTEEIREFLEVQRMRQAKVEMKEPSFFESVMASPLMLATMAIIPALLVIGAAAFFIMRRRKDEDVDVEEPEGLDGAAPDMPAAMVDVDDGTDELVLEDEELEVTDDIDTDELFGDDMGDDLDDINLSDTLELSEEPEEGDLDIDADTDLTSNLDVGLDDDFDTSTDVEANTDDAIGLEDMERALDEMSSQPEEAELSPDEALAAMWEQSLSGGDEEVDDIDALLAAEQSSEGDEVATTEAEPAPEASAEEDASEEALETNEALFDNVLDDEPEVDLSQDIDLSDDDIDDLIGSAAEPESSAEDNTAMLDEPLGEDDDLDLISNDVVEEDDIADPDALLDEMLGDDLIDEDGNTVASEEKDDTDDLSLEPELDADLSETDALLDELVSEDDEDPLDETALLDEAIDDDDLLGDVLGETEDQEEVDLGETDVLLDELIDDGDALEDESALLDEVPDDDLLGDDLGVDSELDIDKDPDLDVDIDNELDIDSVLDIDAETTPEITGEVLGDDSDDAPEEVSDELEIPEPEVAETEEHTEAEESGVENLTELDDALSNGSSETELDELVDDTPVEAEPEPEASESELELLDDVLEQDEQTEEDIESDTEETALDEAPIEEPEATAEDLDLLDSLLDEDASSTESEELDSEQADSVQTELEQPDIEPEASEETAETQDELVAFDETPDTAEAITEELTVDELAPEERDIEDSDVESSTSESPEAENEVEEPQALESESEEPLDVSVEQEAEDAFEAEDEAPLDLSSLPEYDEEAALADSEGESEAISEVLPDDDDTAPLDLENLPEYTEEDAAQEYEVELPTSQEDAAESVESDVAEEEALQEESLNTPQPEQETEEEVHAFTATEPNTLAFPKVDPIGLDELGEFDEDDALSAALDEQRELEEFLPQSKEEGFTQPSAPVSQAPYRAAELDELAQLDDDEHQVAGLNMEALLSEELEEEHSGLGDFETEELDIPEDESDVWSAEQAPEPELESEDWSEQPEVLGDEIKSMDLEGDLDGLLDDVESELVEETAPSEDYISIDELMKDDGVPQEDPDSLKIDLDVGLEDFPDVLSDIQPADVDSSGEAATNMDLAKAYLEMNDVDGAIQLLEKVMQSGDTNLKDEARLMIEKLN
ncbi:FimV/HubP family polar landmark protein [Grimontia sp. NTOU-MAR1]|uniref:FimV/HubP family polar landmark protein n=1 Tax=Grimontia sp. NTOU-MAR1 TaxID=3111011 RepID=UPI002DBD9A83|nr:FimV/HubP family polar landmark protein [Grimontia sp. NTOU-MAR1]WRV99582.1 FimV/HubP family polar landmark protein [Grimontia sp. NTOU-MAR1]